MINAIVKQIIERIDTEISRGKRHPGTIAQTVYDSLVDLNPKECGELHPYATVKYLMKLAYARIIAKSDKQPDLPGLIPDEDGDYPPVDEVSLDALLHHGFKLLAESRKKKNRADQIFTYAIEQYGDEARRRLKTYTGT